MDKKINLLKFCFYVILNALINNTKAWQLSLCHLSEVSVRPACRRFVYEKYYVHRLYDKTS